MTLDCVEIFVKNALSKSKLSNAEYSLNPYRGCEHRCVYCYAPYVLHMSLDEWNSRVRVKVNLPTVLDREMKRKRPRGNISIGTVTDAYQPCERKYEITRKSLQVLQKYRAKITILTKSSLVLRDSDLLSKLEGAEVGVTITTTDEHFRRKVEPGASSIGERFRVLDELPGGVVKYIFVGPLFSEEFLDLELMFRRARDAGVAYILVDKFREKRGMHLPEWLIYAIGNPEEMRRRFLYFGKRYGVPVYFVF